MVKNGRLYVGNLPYDMDVQGLVDAFANFGFRVSRPHVVLDRETGRSKGFGFVEVAERADEAVAMLNGATVGGRRIKVDHAVERERPRE